MMQRKLSGRFHGRGRRCCTRRGRRTHGECGECGSDRPPLQGAAARRRRADRRGAGRRAPEPLHRRIHHTRPGALRRVRRAQSRADGDVLGTARPGLRPARQDVDVPAALRPAARTRRLGHHPRRAAPGQGGARLRHPAGLRGQRDRGRGGPAVDRRRTGGRSGVPVPLLRRLRARRRADGRGAARLRPPGGRGDRAGCGRRSPHRRPHRGGMRGGRRRGGRHRDAAAGGCRRVRGRGARREQRAGARLAAAGWSRWPQVSTGTACSKGSTRSW